MKKIIPICFMFDDNYVTPASVAFFSMLKNADKNYFYKLYVVQAEENIAEKTKIDCEKLLENLRMQP